MEEKLVESNNENEQSVELNYAQLIENKRAPLYKEFTRSRKVSNIMTFVILIIAIAGMYLITNEGWMRILGWSLLGVGVVGMVVFYFLSKRTFETHTKEYIAFVNDTLNKETFNDSVYSDISVKDGKLEVADISGNGAYSDVVRVASRNIITGKYEGKEFEFAEAALFKKGDKKQAATASFVGKYFKMDNSFKFEGNIVINIQREQPYDTPNGVSGKATLYSQDGITVYGDEGIDFRSIIGEQNFGKIKKIKVENHLLNCVISLWEGVTFVFMSYDDDVIAMPFDKPLIPEAFNSFVKDLKDVFGVVKF